MPLRGLVVAAAGAMLLWAAAVAGCSAPPNDYAAYANLPAEGWKYGDSVTFRPVHPDSLCAGRLIVGIRHASDYPYTSLWLEVSYSDGTAPRKDTLEMRLTDSFGSWTGRGIGASFQKADTLPHPLLHITGNPVKIRHIMRADTLRGIEQLGIFFLPEE